MVSVTPTGAVAVLHELRFIGRHGVILARVPLDAQQAFEVTRALPHMDHVSVVERATAGAFGTYQSRVGPWMMECFGPMIAVDRVERHHRFLEEALELVQATGCTADEARQLIEYVYGRPVGEVGQEVGGVMVTLAALCLAHGLDMHEAGETELARVWTKVEQIRAKQAAKPKYGPLPSRATTEGEGR